MVRTGELALASRLEIDLRRYGEVRRSLPGIDSAACCQSLVEQLIESMRRIKYVHVMRERPISDRRTDPNDSLFDPLKASVLYRRRGQWDEAFWMVFLFVHFGKHPRKSWRYARRIYGKLGSSERWGWFNTSVDPAAFSDWLHANMNKIRNPSCPGGFGNHRKYQSLDAYSSNGTGATFESYVKWIGPPRTHRELFEQAVRRANGDSRTAFDDLYKAMSSIPSFGRTARFDYLTMIGKLRLAPIEPGSPYLHNATGPLSGARLLFGARNPTKLNHWSTELANELGVGMQVMEDALCNWQKNPGKFIPFRG